jgi:polyhydroxyalkanoate synthesis regulator phasin
MAKSKSPLFDPSAAAWAQSVLFQALIIQLIESGTLTVEEAQGVFDLALERAKTERAKVPDAERLIQHVHDNLKWDDLYKWAARQPK